jgi:basic membrane protein A
MAESVAGGAAMQADTTGTREDGSVLLSDLGKKASTAETAAKVKEVKDQLKNGSLKVFDTSKFTVTVVPPSGAEGDFGVNTNAKVDANKHLTSYMADVDDDGTYVGETEVVANGEFQESKFRSAPYFDIQIDGINLLDTKF